MKKKTDEKKMVLDLDEALNEIAQTIRPSAQGSCGTTNMFKTDPNVVTSQWIPPCQCYCCSAKIPL